MTPIRRIAALVIVEVLVVSLAACSTTVPTSPSEFPPTAAPVPSITAGSGASPSVSPSGDALPSVTASPSTSAPASTEAPMPPAPAQTGSGADSGSGRWKPSVGASWQWQLSGPLDLSVDAQVYDVDLYDTSAKQVSQLQAQGHKVICYLSAGSYESYRPDSNQFPSAVLGSELDGWPDERWLDIRQLDVLMPIMAARMDLCAEKGFDAVEPDNVDGYQNDSGFSLTAKDQAAYNRALADLAHERGLAVGLKNDLDQVALLQPVFDFAVNEQCFEYDECSVLSAFINAGKPVFHVEYDLPLSSFCPTTEKLKFSSLRKSLDLDAAREPCPS
ncbi:endo alpha-1,4 polygalactosaminidase [Demequina aurantiaca]|uniref:endo alpha-1,4 polygalactosaminidase n=1 Tax=Demequina aurantiaca TaxID=676200 RepID=UPI003D32CA22